MKVLKKWLNRIFIDGLTGMAQGLFATLIVGTIIQQIGSLIGGNVGDIILGYFSDPAKQIKCVFEVLGVTDSISVKLNKKLEVSNGFAVQANLASLLDKKTLVEISDKEYDEFRIYEYHQRFATPISTYPDDSFAQ